MIFMAGQINEGVHHASTFNAPSGTKYTACGWVIHEELVVTTDPSAVTCNHCCIMLARAVEVELLAKTPCPRCGRVGVTGDGKCWRCEAQDREHASRADLPRDTGHR